MKNKLIALHGLTALSVLLYYAAGYFITRSYCSAQYGCGDAGFAVVPFMLPMLVLLPVTIIVDLTFLGHRIAPPKYKHFASSLIPATLISAIILVAATMAIFTYRQDHHQNHYSADKAVALIQACHAEFASYDGKSIFIETTLNDEIQVSGSARPRIAQAVQSFAASCHYNLSDFSLGY